MSSTEGDPVVLFNDLFGDSSQEVSADIPVPFGRCHKLPAELVWGNVVDWMYTKDDEVFNGWKERPVSFSYEATQKSFASRLSQSLLSLAFPRYHHDVPIDQLEIARDDAIVFIIISKHYVSSRKCLEEFTEIMDFCPFYGRLVVPIFYDGFPSDVNNQESSFGEAFRGLIHRISPLEDEVSRWREALIDAGRIEGLFVRDGEDRYQNNIVYDLSKRVGSLSFHMNFKVVATQVKELITMVKAHELKDIVSIGIWGMAGIGKTTLAKLIFDCLLFDQFQISCFLSNVRDTWERKGKLYLQKELLSEICGTDLRIDDIESVSLKLKERPCQKKVLVVLDDVNHLEQLHALCGSSQWFGQGSRIIITTRDYQQLRAFKVDLVYNMKFLSRYESIQLFVRTLTVFNQRRPEEQLFELVRKVISCAEGLPLALIVLASLLSERSSTEWESVLMKLNTNLPSGIYYKLKLSFDSLDVKEKEIFLNIVLFYIGENVKDVMQKLDDRGCNARFGIETLLDRSFITIDRESKVRMHNMLQLMGRKIIHEISQNEIQSQGYRYEIFLSFRGEDTQTNFTSHLYSALCNAGITVFKDDVELQRGSHIKTELLQAIGSSKIAIIIFSREYAGSKWCLEEMSMIMELHKSNGQVVLPVFYNVAPSEIRNQTSSFGDSFKDLIQKIAPPEYLLYKWRTTLVEASAIAGFVVLGSRDESEHVKAIVDNVCDILDKKYLFVADHPVGVDNRVQEVITTLQNHQFEDVIMAGIWGMGGVGKTTLAKAIYNEIGHSYESRCYLPKIREVWDQEKDQVSLQNQLLHEICKTTKMKINSIESGKITLSERLCHKKALVVLDDVDELAQLKALAGSRHWFKPGSIIIITTRDQRLLHEMDCNVYLMKNLDVGESLELFSWHAFKQKRPKEYFIDISRDIVTYSGGLPLALEVLGSHLLGREAKEWKSVLEKLQKIPNGMIQKKLKISFDGLDDLEKEIFLDICCFFIGMDRNDVTHILNGCGLFADIGIKTLVERSLVTIDEKNKLGVHDLLRDMGREIIRKKSPNELGKRSRLWFHEDALTALLKDMGTKAIEGLSLILPQSKKMHFQTKAFKKMKKLRLLRLENVQLRGDYGYISRDVRWLCWHGFPIQYIPSNFDQQELVAIDLKYSNLRQVWKEPQLLERLKILNLSHSPNLVHTPDFSKLPNLEKLILNNCSSLSVIHHSIGLLDKLLLLD